jgi:hypothetical protein
VWALLVPLSGERNKVEYAMGKMTAEKAAKMLAEDGVIVTNEEATQMVDFLRTLAKIAVAQYLREDEQTSDISKENVNQNTQ